MPRIFISHSSAQKDFARKLRSALGFDLCFMDEFDFEPAYKTLDEIYDKLGKTDIFVLLISKEALASDWVNLEIQKANELHESGKISYFTVYIIDDTPLEDVPEWIRSEKVYNLNPRPFNKPLLLAQDVRRKLFRLIKSRNPLLKFRDEIFVGRKDKLGDFEIKSSDPFHCHLSLIVSGRKGVGRHRFAKECLSQILKIDSPTPLTISLDSKSSIEEFITLLNNLTGVFNEEALKERLLGDKEEKLATAIILLETVYHFREVLFITDNQCIVSPEREITEWFTELLNHPDFPQKLLIFSISSNILSAYAERKNKNIIHINLPPLSRTECQTLFNKCLLELDITDKLTPEDITLFIDRLVASPSQLTAAAFTIKEKGLLAAKADIDSLIKECSSNMAPIVEEIFSNADLKDLTILLSQTDFLNIDILRKIFADRIDSFDSCIMFLLTRSLIYAFGPGDKYLKLDPLLADSIRRSKAKLTKDLAQVKDEILSSEIDDNAKITEDLSLYVYQTRQKLKRGELTDDTLLLPSLAIKTIIELYDDRRWPAVVEVCDELLANSYQRYNYTRVTGEIRYWLCLALARQGNSDRFYYEVDYINGYDKEFLIGFYHRNTQNYPSAEKYYRRALKINPNVSKIKRELVGVLLKQRRYDDALTMAKENYESYPGNPYHIDAYFRCIYHKKSGLTKDDKDTLQRLIEEMKLINNPKKWSFLKSMQIYCDYKVKRKGRKEILDTIRQANLEFSNSTEVQRMTNDIYVHLGIENQYKDFPENFE